MIFKKSPIVFCLSHVYCTSATAMLAGSAMGSLLLLYLTNEGSTSTAVRNGNDGVHFDACVSSRAGGLSHAGLPAH